MRLYQGHGADRDPRAPDLGPADRSRLGSYSSCTVNIHAESEDGILNLYANNLVPADFCGHAKSLINAGSLLATVIETITSAEGGLCAGLIYSDNRSTPGETIDSGGQTGGTSFGISAGGDISWGGTILLPSGAGGSYTGQSCAFEVALTGSAGT